MELKSLNDSSVRTQQQAALRGWLCFWDVPGNNLKAILEYHWKENGENRENKLYLYGRYRKSVHESKRLWNNRGLRDDNLSVLV